VFHLVVIVVGRGGHVRINRDVVLKASEGP